MGYMRDSTGRRLDSFPVAERSHVPATRLDKLPGRTTGLSAYLATAYSRSVWTTPAGDYRYEVVINELANPIIVKRNLATGTYTSFDLSTIAGNPLAAPTAADSHNVYAVAVDSAGYIHVTGNHHNHPLRYARSAAPGDITAWTAATMVGDETLVSYPEFVPHPDGTLLFFCRQGGSGNGDTIVNRLANPATGAWVRQAELIDGVTAGQSAYPHNVVCDRNGVLHVAFEWRTAWESVDTNHDVCYVRSPNKGLTWTDVDGQAVSLPLTPATAPVACAIPEGSLLVNQGGLGVDADGNPHVALVTGNGGNRQIAHLRHDGTAWSLNFVTAFTETGTSTTKWPSRPAVVCTRNGRTYLVYRHSFDYKQGAVRMIDVTAGPTYGHDFALFGMDLRMWEASVDPIGLRDHNQLAMIVAPVNTETGPSVVGYNADNSWDRQWMRVLTVDLNQVASIQSGAVEPIRPRVFASGSIPYGTTITSTSLTTLTTPDSVTVGREMRGRLVLARLTVHATVTAGQTLTLRLREKYGGLGRYFGDVLISAASGAPDVSSQTPWMPLDGPEEVGVEFATVYLLGLVSGGTGTIRGATVELATLG